MKISNHVFRPHYHTTTRKFIATNPAQRKLNYIRVFFFPGGYTTTNKLNYFNQEKKI